MELKDIAKQFKLLNKNITYLEPYGEGHINTTYLVRIEGGAEYILQKINNHIFTNVPSLMNNIYLVLEYLKKLKGNSCDVKREVMNLILTEDEKLFFYDKSDDSYYRVYDFVVDSIALQTIENAELFKESAVGFGKFALDLQGFDASKLYEVIKDFHNTEARYNHFIKALEADVCDRKKTCQNEIQFILDRKDYCSKIVNKIRSGDIPLRVTHNDTKLNNILLDKNTLKALCVIDLDTIMPGSLLYDFGDSIRFGCNPAGESERDVSKVVFNIEYFKAYCDGYLSRVKDTINKDELDNLAFSAILMTLECGIRFVDDYLDGDHYFKTKFADHNLVRARTQFKLVSDMEKLLKEMDAIVHISYQKALSNN